MLNSPSLHDYGVSYMRCTCVYMMIENAVRCKPSNFLLLFVAFCLYRPVFTLIDTVFWCVVVYSVLQPSVTASVQNLHSAATTVLHLQSW